MVILGIILFVVLYRYIRLKMLQNKVLKKCWEYDWKHIQENKELVLFVHGNPSYFKDHEWSAFNFLFLKGYGPLRLFFNLKPMTLKAQYNEDALRRLSQYENR